MDPSSNTWQSLQQVDDFAPMSGGVGRAALNWFAVLCLERIHHLLVPNALRLAEMLVDHVERRMDRSAIPEAYDTFLRTNYTPHIVRDQVDGGDFDIGEFDSAGSDAVAKAVGVAVADLIHPDEDWSTSDLFWIAAGVAESCRRAVQNTIPDLPWQQEALPKEMEGIREELLKLRPEERQRLQRTHELNTDMHLVLQTLYESSSKRQEERNALWEAEEIAQCDLAREVIPPPELPSLDPSWRTAGVISLANEILETEDLSKCMPSQSASSTRAAIVGSYWIIVVSRAHTVEAAGPSNSSFPTNAT